MASILDSFRDVFTDRLSLLKIFVLTLPAYYSYQLYLTSKGSSGNFLLVSCLTLFLLFGFLIKVTGNVINEYDSVLPSLNPFKLAFAALKGLIAIGPFALFFSFLASYGSSFIHINPIFDIVLKSIIWILALSVIVTSFLMFTPTEKILDAFKLKLLFEKAGDLIVSLIVFLLQFIIINVPTAGYIGYIMFILFGLSPIFIFYVTFAIIFNIATTGQYLAQIHYEVFTYDKHK